MAAPRRPTGRAKAAAGKKTATRKTAAEATEAIRDMAERALRDLDYWDALASSGKASQKQKLAEALGGEPTKADLAALDKLVKALQNAQSQFGGWPIAS